MLLLGSSGKDDEKEEVKIELEETKNKKKKKKEDAPTAGPQLPPQIDDDSIGKPWVFYIDIIFIYIYSMGVSQF